MRYRFGMLVAMGCALGASAVSPDEAKYFETTIRPLLAAKCYACHSGERTDGGLSIDSLVGFTEGGASGRPLVDGMSGTFIDVIHGRDTVVHPDIDTATNELETFMHWIHIGAPWPEESAIDELDMPDRIAVARERHWAFQPVERPTAPNVSNDVWAQTDIDRFIARQVEEAGIPLSPMADKRTLLRRAYYDLIGLPPTWEDLQKFGADDSPDAFAKVIDELLASPRYGERWGRHWLDVARYSDTKGQDARYEPYFPFSYTYRDYVIRAFNEDVSYDRFIIEQLAADQLDLGEDNRALAALGFITLGRQFPGDYHATLDDQIDVVTRGFQGLTVSCARCHDHKHDPIPTADYYSLYGIFRSAKNAEPWPLIGESRADSSLVEEYQAKLDELNLANDTLRSELWGAVQTNFAERRADYFIAVGEAWSFTSDEEFEECAKRHELNVALIKRWRDYIRDDLGPDNSVFGLWHVAANEGLAAFHTAAPKCENPQVQAQFIFEQPLTVSQVFATYSKLFDRQHYVQLFSTDVQDLLDCGFVTTGITSDPSVRAMEFVLQGLESPLVFTSENLYAFIDDESRAKLRAREEAIRKHQYTHPGRPPRAMALENQPQPFDPYIFVRGNAQSEGEKVPRRFLDVLTEGEAQPFTPGKDRLDLAKAIASKDNPLTARVMVNRVWMNHFGRPLVGTPSDFGLRGEAPSHPELLDYLAWQFMEDGWSIKQLHRRIMLTRTYQQSSREHAEGAAKDQDNHLFWRQNRRRLDFEAMRDSLLVAGGNLDVTMGGPSQNIIGQPFTTRRTVYAEIDRQFLPSVFGTFDFALPNSHRSKRHATTVPQQALFMMNSPFVAQQAKALAARYGGENLPVQEMYRELFLRDPSPRELAMVEDFVNQPDTGAIQKPYTGPIRWQYGYGKVDQATGKVVSFTEFVHWNGEAYQPSEDQEIGPAQLDQYGGHPGTPGHAAIRRWISPVDSTLGFVGELFHYSPEGDGITGYVVSSREGILWQGELQDGMLPTVFEDAQIRKGDTVDLVIACNGDATEDRFRWHPRLYLSADDAAKYPKQDWLTRFDYAPPPPKAPEPLTPWERYAQVLLMTNEFMFVD